MCYALPVFLFRSTVFASFPMVIVGSAVRPES